MNFAVLLTYITPHRRVLMAVLGLLLAGSLVLARAHLSAAGLYQAGRFLTSS